jgi:[ribosomal protein S5]-alanine N-acetyltransferase
MITLETERLLLRDFVPSDWEAINAIVSDPEVTRHMHFSTWTHEQRREWFDWCIENNHEPNRDVYNWGITLQGSDALIGWFGIGSSSRATVAGERGFGYLLHRHYWGQGYMTEVLLAIIAYEFETLGTPRLSATCETDNHASARVMEKAGMRHERTIHDTDFEGNWAYRHHYAIDNR